jgi:hypothetical protein
MENWKPTFRFQEMKAAHLIRWLVRLRFLGRDTLARVILSAFPDADLKKVADETEDLTDNLNWEIIDRLCDLCDNPVPAMLLVDCIVEQDAIYKEINERLTKSVVGAEILRLSADKVKPTSLLELHKALTVDRITTYRPEKESDEDLRAIAVGAAMKAFNQIGHENKADLEKGPYPKTPLAKAFPVASSAWGQWKIRNSAMEKRDFALMQEYYLPALEGKKISERARQALRDHFEAREAKKRTAETLSLDRAKKESVSPPWESYFDAGRAYKIAVERYGQKGQQFLDTLKDTENIKEASARAGISRQMGHRYLIEIRKELNRTKK